MPRPPRLAVQIPVFTLLRVIINTPHRMIYPFLPVFARGLGVDLASMSLALTARNLVGTVNPLVASVTDRHGRRTGMLMGSGLFLGGAALVALLPSFPALVAALVLMAMGKNVFEPAMQAYVSDRIPYERRGLALAVTEIAWSLAFIAGVPAMGLLVARGGWKAPFPLLALLGLLVCAGVALIVAKDERPAAGGPGMVANFRTVLTSGPALAGLALGLSVSAANEMVNLVFGVWLEHSFGLKIAALGAAAAVIGISELCGEGLVAAFVDRLGKPRAVALGLAANSLAALLLPVVGRTEAGAVAGLSLFYLSFEFTVVSAIPMLTELMPGARATLLAFSVAAMTLGRAISAPLATLLFTFGFPAVTAGGVAFNLLAFLALRRVRASLGIGLGCGLGSPRSEADPG
jgi:predicted MFS family arabinose efflux permease